MSKSILEEILNTQTFVSLPPVTMKILDMLRSDGDLDIKKLSKIIETDAALTAQIVRVSNSPLFATRSQTHSVSQAVLAMGLNRLTNIVLGISIFSKEIISENPEMKELVSKYRWHTSSTAAVSKSLAHKLRENFREFEFIGGLLYNIGKLAMLQYDIGKYKKVIELITKNGIKDIDAEREIYGIDHEAVGAGISQKWALPTEIAMIMKHHTNVLSAPVEHQKCVAVVRIASMLCGMWGADFYNGDNVIEFENTTEYEILVAGKSNIDLDFEQITFELEIDFKNSQDFLNIVQNVKK